MTRSSAVSIDLPTEPTNCIAFADWLELSALVASDGNASRGDAERALKQLGIFDFKTRAQDESIEVFLDEVFAELGTRTEEAQHAYPFIVSRTLVEVKDPWKAEFLPYVFCLCLSHFGETNNKHADGVINGRKLFELLAADAMSAAFQAKTLVVGTSKQRTKIVGKSAFATLVDEIATHIGEGRGFKSQPTLNKKDDHTDLVCVRKFDHSRPSNLLVFGQCASGADWTGKTTELQPSTFCEQWFMEKPIGDVQRSFFMPYCIESERWGYHSRYAGFLFDRLRIARWGAEGLGAACTSVNLQGWIKKVLPRMVSLRSV